MSKDFETLWVALLLPYKKFLSLLVNVSYNPEESETDMFLEELALQTYYGITKKQKIYDFEISIQITLTQTKETKRTQFFYLTVYQWSTKHLQGKKI